MEGRRKERRSKEESDNELNVKMPQHVYLLFLSFLLLSYKMLPLLLLLQ